VTDQNREFAYLFCKLLIWLEKYRGNYCDQNFRGSVAVLRGERCVRRVGYCLISEYDFYAQENWKVLPRWMLTIGLRYDLPG
jgi:outer membrane receptor for ferrienterochelin and colicin